MKSDPVVDAAEKLSKLNILVVRFGSGQTRPYLKLGEQLKLFDAQLLLQLLMQLMFDAHDLLLVRLLFFDQCILRCTTRTRWLYHFVGILRPLARPTHFTCRIQSDEIWVFSVVAEVR